MTAALDRTVQCNTRCSERRLEPAAPPIWLDVGEAEVREYSPLLAVGVCLVEPTKSWVITAAWPPAKMVVDGWTADGKAAISLKQPSVVPLGWLIFNFDVAIRPLIPAPTPETKERIPLSLDDLLALLYVPLTSALDEVTEPGKSGTDSEVAGSTLLVFLDNERPAFAVETTARPLRLILDVESISNAEGARGAARRL